MSFAWPSSGRPPSPSPRVGHLRRLRDVDRLKQAVAAAERTTVSSPADPPFAGIAQTTALCFLIRAAKRTISRRSDIRIAARRIFALVSR